MDGGGIYMNNIAPVYNNVVICGNSAASKGGGVYTSTFEKIPVFTNVTIAGNNAVEGGGIYTATGSPIIQNSIIYGNSTNVANTTAGAGSSPQFAYSLIQGSGGSAAWPGFSVGTNNGNNIDADPQFVDLIASDLAPTTDGNYSLQTISPANDVGNNAVVTTTGDAAGAARIQDGTVNMGAYEATLALPVNFGAIVGKIENGQLLINWQTLNETNNDHFDIEASTDGEIFKVIGTVVSKAENGNSPIPLNYEFVMDMSTAGKLWSAGLMVVFAGLFYGKHRKDAAFLGMVCLAIAITFPVWSCSKEQQSMQIPGKHIYIRIAQFDKDNTKKYSTVIKVNAE